MMKEIRTEYLVIGAGLAGLTYASTMAAQGHDVLLIDSGHESNESNSMLAQGGIVYPIKDTIESLLADMKTTTAGVSNPEIIQDVFSKGKSAIDETLIDFAGVEFDRDSQGEFQRTIEGGHSQKRIIHIKDATGKHIMRPLVSKCKKIKNLKFMYNSMAIDLVTPSHNSTAPQDRFLPLTCLGAYIKNFDNEETHLVLAKKTVLATGGIGQVYNHTTNSPDSFGHGISMAKRIGARIMDMEYIQFHPTVFLKKGHCPLLISEAVRGEGGIITDEQGDEIMTEDIHPLKSLAPRDIVARTIKLSLLKSREKNVFIDLKNLNENFIRERFPNIFKACLERGVDITKEPVPVVPAAHYICGGIYTDKYGQTNILGLSAIGENACTGFHGANRLASTSLLECVSMAKIMAKNDIQNPPQKIPNIEIKPWENADKEASETLIEQDLNIVRETLWNYCGPIRNQRGLNRASHLLSEMDWQVKNVYRNCKITKGLLNLRSGVDISKMILHACWNNRVSSGCHYRES
jgi:L-aspartate oxidase